ncbi:hypothetical protein JRQ81_000286, partial [Phrynocephalus forsythii]
MDKTPYFVTTSDSDVEEHMPPSSSEPMRNYSNFILHMAKSIDLLFHHPKLCHTDHPHGKISSDNSTPVHLGVIPSFLSMAEESFKISPQPVSRRIESLCEAPFLSKHPHPNSVVVTASQGHLHTKQMPISPSKEGRKLDSLGR